MYVNVALPLPLDQLYTYSVPEHLQDRAQPGMRVLVPFGTRQSEGVIVQPVLKPDYPHIKDITDCLDATPFFDAYTLALTRWIAEYYLASWGQALKCAIPAGISLISRRMVSLTEEINAERIEEIGQRAPAQASLLKSVLVKPASVSQLHRQSGTGHFYATLATCQERGWIKVTDEIKSGMKPKSGMGVFLKITPEEAREQLPLLDRRAPKQAAVMRALLNREVSAEAPLMAALVKEAEATSTTIRSMEKKGLVVCEPVTITRDPMTSYEVDTTPPPQLNEAQQEVLGTIEKSLEAQQHEVFLLYGVTGSGKTEVYMRAMAQVLAQGRSAIVLVPEISLTPQTLSRFASRFGERITVLHSQLSQGERYDQWQRIRRGEVDIVVGPRSAVFAPFARLGLIVIDEEHETTYKQDDPAPRYHAREVAIKRAQLTNATVVLGTATPSLESYYQAKQQKYRLLTMPDRIQQIPMPPVQVVDMRQELIERQNRTIFSTALRDGILDRLQKKEQVILFLNRRGHSTYVFCRECGYVEECENCSITMTYHFNSRRLVCHHCNEDRPAPKACPKCRSGYIRYFGLGTQQVEEEANKAFPDATIVRMDTDSTTGKNAHQRILRAFRAGEIDILIGTQMVAKGLDFPKVTLVGVILADTALHLPDFRAGERSFNLLTQVAGRAGRSIAGGDVILQSYQPEHYSIMAASHHDYDQFYAEEITKRDDTDYPPVGHALSILVHGESEDTVRQACYVLESILIRLADVEWPNVVVLGPAPAPLTKIRRRFRWHFLLKAPKSSELRELVKKAMNEVPPTITRGDVEVVLNMDPMTVL